LIVQGGPGYQGISLPTDSSKARAVKPVKSLVINRKAIMLLTLRWL
jgi:hypothetical protein